MSRPVICDKLSAAMKISVILDYVMLMKKGVPNIVYIKQLIPVTARIETQLLADTMEVSIQLGLIGVKETYILEEYPRVIRRSRMIMIGCFSLNVRSAAW